ncbi:hypothetical protein N0V85_005164 [Neurospora sp. IMI 360204]|nr:hypothetical protein N0V85_005164 [Neurospora sp. IMI 360204]
MAEVAIREVARAYGLPELVHLIHEYSSPSVLLWRAILTYTLALQLALLPEQPFTEIPLVDIVKWKRGDLLVPSDREQVSTIDDAKSVMRITLDNRGIKEIKRLSRHPSFTETWFEGHGFIVERLSKLREFTACGKDGLLRLRFPESYNGELPMWDTPDPPSPDQTEHLISLGFGLRFSRCYPSHKGITMCHTLDLKLVTGLTFIFNHNGDLLKTFPHFSGYTGHYNPLVFEEHRAEGFSYLPIASGDQIVYIGVIPPENNRIFVRMRLSGDIVINMMTRDSARKLPVFWSKKNPKGLIYGHGLCL